MQISTNWVITSPGRTGSRFISDVLTIFYKEKFGVDTKYVGPGAKYDPHGHWQMYHTHDPTQIVSQKRNARSILSVRDIVESALSYCVVDRTKLYHVFGSTNIGTIPRVKQFHLPVHEFMEQYAYQVGFYRQVRGLVQPDTIIVRYSSMASDWRSILWGIGIEAHLITPEIQNKIESLAPIKNHWDSQQWISNWGEIDFCIRSLPRDPEIFIKNASPEPKTQENKNE